MKTTIAFRLLLIVIFSAITALTVGLVGMLATGSLTDSLRKAQSVTVPQVNSLHRIIGQSLRVRVHVYNHARAETTEEMDKIEKAMTKSMAVLWEEVGNYEKLVSDPKDREMLEADKESLKVFEASLAPVVAQNRQNIPNDPEAKKLINAVVKTSADAARSLNAHYEQLFKDIEADRTAAEAAASRHRSISWAVIIIGVGLIACFGLLLVRSIRSTLAGVQGAITRIEGERDFRIRAPEAGQDELSRMGASLNRLIGSMQSNLQHLGENARDVAGKSRHMAGTAQQVSMSSGQQSESASAMAAAIEELTVSIGHIGDRASEANQLSQDSGRHAQEGGQIIGQTVQDIHEIASTVNETSSRIRIVEAESDKISSVVAVIREVADQTNLLALNAAIEAARAGEQGRGFAVVADEVRKLAERTANSTREITTMIDGVRNGAKDAVNSMAIAVDRVSIGVSRAEGASQAIARISETSSQAVEMVREITDAIREQSAASHSIAQQVERIAQMAEVGNEGAAMSAAAAHELDTLAASMQQIVQTYKL
ncbi:methyl-accepting chemotaxis protein [Uliginosibacterium sp. 31-16]|uniref:methyl-accepting chemotaxis protein n=1 Tax=Uliginosibacterium sp. 31-16 TaxID=3068315 RepID=UPI00273DBE34|nr:methyl-accepting chemotaxis protein [Uliginosibacterium sp. 31-16]MDP5239183.1 methyl-accepting chemotaxis protein [Uliginosibacterium sp. 31-16]